MRFVLAAFVVLGCSAGTAAQPTEDVTDVALSAEPTTSVAERQTSAPVLSPRRALAEPQVAPTEVPPQPPGTPADIAVARALFLEGVQAYQAGDFSRAEMQFVKAYAVAPRSPVLFNLAKVLLLEGKTADACAAYARWWTTLNPPDPSKRAELPTAQCPNLANLP